MSDVASAWARSMGRALELKTPTRFVLLTLANEAGTRPHGFVVFQEALAADTGMSLSAVKVHLSHLRRAHLVIAGDPRMAAGYSRDNRPCVYRLNLTIDPRVAKALLEEGLDRSKKGQPESGDGQNQAMETAETSEIDGSQNLATQLANLSGFGSQNQATNPLRGYAAAPKPARRMAGSKPKKDDDGRRLCIECVTRKPLHEMQQLDDGRFMCESHAA